jgi:hypothetical protein
MVTTIALISLAAKPASQLLTQSRRGDPRKQKEGGLSVIIRLM